MEEVARDLIAPPSEEEDSDDEDDGDDGEGGEKLKDTGAERGSISKYRSVTPQPPAFLTHS